MPPRSEYVFQRELHNPRIRRRCDLPELAAVPTRVRIPWADAVRNVESFDAELDAVIFTDFKASGERHIQAPESRAQNVAAAHRPDCADSRLRESVRVEVVVK